MSVGILPIAPVKGTLASSINTQPTSGSLAGRNVVLWKQILASSLFTLLGVGILVGGAALVLHTPSLRPKGGLIVLATSIVGLGGAVGGVAWLISASTRSFLRAKVLQYLQAGEESYKNDENKLYTICFGSTQFFARNELTSQEIEQRNKAQKYYLPFVTKRLSEFNKSGFFMQIATIEDMVDKLVISRYDCNNKEDPDLQAFLQNWRHVLSRRGLRLSQRP